MFDTGVHVQLPKNTVGFLKSKSGLNVKHGITSEGVIDVGYTGSIIVKLYNHGSKPYKVCRGDKISQLVILPCILPELEVVSSLEETERGDKGSGVRADDGGYYKTGILHLAGRIPKNCVRFQALIDLHCCYCGGWDNKDGIFQFDGAGQSYFCR